MNSQAPTLTVAEYFTKTHQLEGRNSGMPAAFLRFQNCNLSCGMSQDAVHQLRQKLDKTPDYVVGGYNQEDADLFKEGKATWVCDSISVWLRGREVSVDEIIDSWKKEGAWEWIGMGRITVIITGGEPTLPKTQKEVVKAVEYIKKKYEEDFGAPCHLYLELETNGTFALSEEFGSLFAQINCSVKLANSGMPSNRRIVPLALQSIIKWNSDFKFVVSSEEDMKEINRDFIAPFGIHWSKIYIQPGLDRQEDAIEKMKKIHELAWKYGVRAGGRGQILMFNTATGV